MSHYDGPVVVVGVSGPSCCGKSTLSRHLRSVLAPHVTLLYQDDFYRPDSQIPYSDIPEDNGGDQDNEAKERGKEEGDNEHKPQQKFLQDWDCPEAYDFDKLRRVLLHLKQSGGTSFPPEYVSHESGNERGEKLLTPEQTTRLRSLFVKENSSLPGNDNTRTPNNSSNSHLPHIILLDGIMLFHETSPLWDLLDIKLLITGVGYEALKQRREARGVYCTSEGSWVDPPGYFDKIVWPGFLKAYGYLYERGGDTTTSSSSSSRSAANESVNHGTLSAAAQQRGVRALASSAVADMEESVKWVLDLIHGVAAAEVEMGVAEKM